MALQPSQLPVVILAGGMGIRLREETERVPKPLVLIGEQPMLWHVMKLYGAHGSRRFLICLGYKSWLIKEYFLRYREAVSDVTVRTSDDGPPFIHPGRAREDWEVMCAETGLTTATGARLWRVRDAIDTDTFFFTYGDGIGNVDICALLEHHLRSGRIGTVTGVHPTSRYGEMRVDGDQVVEFNEKPTQPEGFVSGGFFVFNRGIFDYLHDDPNLFIEYAPLQNLARDGELSVFRHEDFWLGMDTYRDFMLLNDLWTAGRAPWAIWEQ